jgi:hypothetical protein
VKEVEIMNKLIPIVLVLAAACGKKDGDSKGSSKAAAAIDLAAINALVPAPLKGQLEFVKRDIVIKSRHHDTTYSVAAPKSWKDDPNPMWASLKGDDAAGFMTGLKINSNCDGDCKPKDWAAVSDKVEFAEQAMGKTVISDVKRAGGRTKIAAVDDGTVRATSAWWSDGDSKYHSCTYTLDVKLKDAAPAFAKACEAVSIDGDD